MKFKEIKENPSVLFLGKLLLFYFLWNGFVPNSIGDGIITTNLADAGTFALQLAGLQAHKVTVATGIAIYIDQHPLLIIGPICNGVDFFGLFTCFVLAFPARWKHKAWFLPLGIFTIHLLNVIRIVLLSFNCWYSRQTFDFNHKYTFIVVVYGVMLVLWMMWAKRYSLYAERSAS